MSGGAQGGQNQRNNYEEMANLEEAFRYQEMELQKERENANNMRINLMKLTEASSKNKEKSEANKKKLKKFNELANQSKRQA